MNCACEEPSLLSWLANHIRMVIVWKILASCIQLAYTCYQKLTCGLDLLGGKQTNKETCEHNTNTLFYNIFSNGLPYFSVSMDEEVIYYWKLHTVQHTALSSGNNCTSSVSVYIVYCVYKEKCDLQY